MPRRKSNEAYEVLSCRVPPGLTARLSAHAKLHSQRVRDVIVQAILASLDGTHVAPIETSAARVVRDAKQHLSAAGKLLDTLHAPRRASAGPPVASVAPQSDTNGVDVPLQPDGTPAYDIEKYHLGKLCPKSHRWNGMDSTLRTNKGSKCLECEKEGKKKRREAQHQAIEAPAD